MTQWLPAAILSLLSFGLWGLFTKFAILHVDSKSALIFQTAGVLLVGLFILSTMKFKPASDIRGISFGLLTGIAYGLGCLFYFIAADKGKITTVVTLTALYPLVTILLSYFLLREAVSMKQGVGILLALFSIYLLSS